ASTRNCRVAVIARPRELNGTIRALGGIARSWPHRFRRFADAPPVSGRERRGARAIGHVIEWLDRDRAGVAVAAQRRGDRCEAHVALSRRATVRIVDLDV